MLSWRDLLSKPARAPLKSRPSLTLFFLLIGTFFLTFVPHIAQMPFWVSFVIVLALFVRSVLEVYRLPLPSTTFCGLMAVFLLPGIYLQYRTVFGREAGTAFMAGLLAIKFFELRGPRDISVIIFSSFFVVMSTLLYSEALELFIYCLIMMWILTALLVRLQSGDRPEDSLIRMLQRSGLLFLQALPLALFLFFFFPRFTGKFQMTLNESVLGLNDRVEPGSISRLAKDNSKVMYVTFLPNSGSIPSPDTMYWRGLVLWNYDKGAWTEGTYALLPEAPPLPLPDSPLLVQRITIYPHFQKWLFALDHPISQAYPVEETNSTWSTIRKGDVVQLNGDHATLDHKVRYGVTSTINLEPSTGSVDAPKEIATELPRKVSPGQDKSKAPLDINPDIIALADSLYPASGDSREYADAVFSYFRKHLKYTLSPNSDPKDPDWMHTFLFERRTGFCEHFASTFAVLMRIKKVPARVVVGYLGAQYNPYDNSYIVYQSNAHAWDEIWIDKRGWVRFDPTSVFSINESGQPSQAGTPDGDEDADISIQIAHRNITLLSSSVMPGWVRRAVVEMQLRRQQVEANWDDWVFSYDPDAQTHLATLLGFGRNPRFWFGIASVTGILICVGFFRAWMRRKPPAAPVEILYTLFCRNMARRGIPRAPWEGPLAYTGRAAEAFPEKEETIRDIGGIVTRTRYGASPPDPGEIKKLEQLLAALAVSHASTPHETHTVS